MISYKEAVKNILQSNPKPIGTKKLFLGEALDEILAQDIVAFENSPAYETSSMDGYAFRFEDQEREFLEIADILPAGSFKEEILAEGRCVKTFTGSLMSKGSDTLIPIENVTVKDNKVYIEKKVPFGFSVRSVGENYKKGEVLIKKGTKIGFAEIGVMASLNVVQVEVYRKPTVGIISTGSEIVDVGETMSNPSQIRSSNHLTLEALSKQNGALVNRYSLVKDDKDKIKDMILDSLRYDDITITTGGVSVGDFDFVRDILGELKIDFVVDKVSIKPGRHIKILKIGEKYIFALPGFAYSSTVTFILFVLPILWAMKGEKKSHESLMAKLSKEFTKKTNFTEFVACNLKNINGEYIVDFGNKRDGSSAILTNMLDNASLLVATKESYKKDEYIEILRFL